MTDGDMGVKCLSAQVVMCSGGWLVDDEWVYLTVCWVFGPGYGRVFTHVSLLTPIRCPPPLQNICFMVQSRSFITTNYTNDTK